MLVTFSEDRMERTVSVTSSVEGKGRGTGHAGCGRWQRGAEVPGSQRALTGSTGEHASRAAWRWQDGHTVRVAELQRIAPLDAIVTGDHDELHCLGQAGHKVV